MASNSAPSVLPIRIHTCASLGACGCSLSAPGMAACCAMPAQHATLLTSLIAPDFADVLHAGSIYRRSRETRPIPA